MDVNSCKHCGFMTIGKKKRYCNSCLKLITKARAEERAEWKQRIDDLIDDRYPCDVCANGYQKSCRKESCIERRLLKSLKGEGGKE